MKKLVLITLFLVSQLSIGTLRFSPSPVHAAQASRSEKLDSIINYLDTIQDDSIQLRQVFIEIQNNLNHYWGIDLINHGIELADKHRHLVWYMAFHGSRVRWSHRMHDWKRMDEYLMDQRKKAFRNREFGNYMSQIGQSAIVMASIGRFEQSWHYIQMMEKDMKTAGDDIYKKYDIYNYLVKADYYKYRGDEAKRLALLLAAWENKVETNSIQRITLHIELIDVFGQLGQYKEAIAQADSALAVFNTYSPERRALPQSRGDISDANLRKVAIYEKLKDYPKMKECLLIAEEYMDQTQPANIGDIYVWWAKYYLGVNDYANSLEFIDKAIEVCREHKTYQAVLETRMQKAHLLIAMGRHEDALDICIPTLPKLDSVRNEMIATQHEYLAELDDIITQRGRSENLLTLEDRLLEAGVFVLIVGVIISLIYVLRARKTLKRNHEITKARLQVANDADKEKELFLRNITKLIGEPLKGVVKGAKRLAEDSGIQPEEQRKLVETNKKEVGLLLELVNNVLDLSRLEACMMKYQTSELDIIQSLNSFVGSYNIRNMNTPIRIAYDVESYVMEIDPSRFSKIVESLFAVPYSYKGEIPEHRSIKVEPAAHGSVTIRISGSLYADESKLTESERMVNKINRFFLRDFDSSYVITPDHDIIITLNS